MVPVVAGRSGKIIIRQHIRISGIVQGVGFRPFIYRLAHETGLIGWVRNTPGGVEIEAQGSPESLTDFGLRISRETPPLASISSITTKEIAPFADGSFSILPSAGGAPDIRIAPDSALCNDCLREMFDPGDRRYRHPFITCTNCGPRYSIVTGIPYDRSKTTMADFPMCPECQSEYHDPYNRRFHAQPIACPKCGPQLRLLTSPSHVTTTSEAELSGDFALRQAVILLKQGHILAVKGIGGYHLSVDACNHAAVQRLRERKKRDEKPFAVMAANLACARALVVLDDTEERLLTAPESPIIIARKRLDYQLAPLVAPDNGWLGLMLPYAPLHHLLMQDNFIALVMTSANLSDEPVAFEDKDALDRLAGIADYFLVHDRPIHSRCDDSIMRVFQHKPLFYRRARGFTPLAIQLPFEVPPLLAVGAELKGAVCLARADRAFLSQHIGDLQNTATYDAFCHTINHLSGILGIKPDLIACDQHPDYQSSIYADESNIPQMTVQHHHAHLAACMAENGLTGDVIGIIYDGTGYGSDGNIWGGEYLVGGYEGFQRAGHFRPVRLPGGDAAVREPWRMALAYLHQALGNTAFSLNHPVTGFLTGTEQLLFASMLEKGLSSPLTSSCGRLFDAVAALLNIRQIVSYDGQAAIELEALAETATSEDTFPFTIAVTQGAPLQIDFTPMFPAVLSVLQTGVSVANIAHSFHATLAQASIEACLQIAKKSRINRVVLSGGVFQNRLLSEMLYTGLTKSGLQVFTHRLTPPNDGCIALGQAAIAGWQTRRNN